MDDVPHTLNNKEAAAFLGVAPNTLLCSRSTGRLLGIEAPPFMKLGHRTVRYDRFELARWQKKLDYHRTLVDIAAEDEFSDQLRLPGVK